MARSSENMTISDFNYDEVEGVAEFGNISKTCFIYAQYTAEIWITNI